MNFLSFQNNLVSTPVARRIFLFILSTCYIFINTGIAQSEKNTRKHSSDSYWKIGVGYLSNYVYMGRQDSLPTPYLTPTITYNHVSGFYVSGSVSYLMQNKSRRVDYGSIDLGYTFDLTERISGEVYANKSWYNQSSTNVTSDITGYLGGSIGFDVNFFQVNAGMDILFSNKPDFTCNLGVSHIFELGDDENEISIEPSFSTYWSTLHSYEGYINRRVGKRPGSGLPLNTTITAVTKVQNNRLTLMDFEVALPFTYVASHFGINFTPTLAIPRNPIYTTTTITTTTPGGIQNSQTFPSTPSSELTLQHRFYAELTVFFTF